MPNEADQLAVLSPQESTGVIPLYKTIWSSAFVPKFIPFTFVCKFAKEPLPPVIPQAKPLVEVLTV